MKLSNSACTSTLSVEVVCASYRIVLMVSFASDAVFQEGSFLCMCLAVDKIGI